MKNYGLIIPEIQPNQDYVLGGFNSIGGTELQPDGQGGSLLPEVEYQLNKLGFDAIACASFGTLSALEILALRVYGQTRNWSDRFLAKTSDTQPNGNSPHKVAETLRKLGVPNEIDYPFSKEIKTWVEFYADIPKAIYSLAIAFLNEFNFKHEYVVTKPDYLKQALKYSPVGISVTAWFKRENGLYYFPEGQTNNHWVVLVGYKENEYWIIYDSYNVAGEGDSVIKKVEWNAQFAVAKRFSLERQVVSEKSWVKYLVDLVLAAFGLPVASTAPPVATLTVDHSEDTTPAIETPAQRLAEEAKAFIGLDASPQNLAPQELSCAEGVVNIVNACWPNTLSDKIVGTDA